MFDNTRKVLKLGVILSLFGLLNLPLAVSAELTDNSSPRQQIQETVDELVKIVESHPGEGSRDARRSEMRKIIEPRFDFKEMAKRSLGKYWKECTDEERNEYVDLFSDLLAKTYLARIEKVESDTVSVDSEKIKQPKALVKTTIRYKGDEFPIDYKLLNRDGKWRVYDVIIENIGLVANYRNEFSGIIRKKKMQGLLEKLRNKS